MSGNEEQPAERGGLRDVSAWAVYTMQRVNHIMDVGARVTATILGFEGTEDGFEINLKLRVQPADTAGAPTPPREEGA